MESCYERPEEFLPERWGDKLDLVLNKAVFVPFSSGEFFQENVDSVDSS